MTGLLVDTNVPSELIRPRPASEVVRWFEFVENDLLYLSVISIAEVIQGIERLPESKRRRELEQWLAYTLRPLFEGRILPVTEAIAETLGRLLAARESQGRPMELADALIAATALDHDFILVTRNTKHFAGLGIPLLDPWRHWVF